MTKVVRSARGVIVDFDMMKIKSSISATPAPINVEARERFVNEKLNRRLQRRAQQVPKELIKPADEKPETTEGEESSPTLPKVKKANNDTETTST